MSPVRPAVTVVGRRLGADDHRLRDLLTRTAQPYDWIEAGTEEAAAVLREHGATEADLPLLVDGETVFAPATLERVASAWRLNDPPRRSEYDLVIVGAGPAGLAAAVYAASDGLDTLVVEADVPGGQASHTSLIENLFGFPEGIGGAELARLGGRQAEGFGAELLLLRGVTSSARGDDGRFVMSIAGGHEVRAPVVIAAPGMNWRRLEAEGIGALLECGVYYGAGRSEAAQCGEDDVVVVGAGNSAGQAVMNLADAGARVKMVVRGDGLGRSMSRYLADRIEAHPLIDVRFGTQVDSVRAADGQLSCVVARGPDGAAEQLPARALFLCLGGTPRTGWADAVGVCTDAAGYILTGPHLVHEGSHRERWPLERDPLALETSVPGLFAAGDARHGSAKRVAGAAGDGATAVALAHVRLEEIARGA